MPGFDQTGPQGRGPMTGRGMGVCYPGSAQGRGRGAGFFGRGMARGRGRGFRQAYDMPVYYGNPVYPADMAGEAEDEIAVLKEKAGFLQRQLEEINRRVDSLNRNEKPPLDE